VLKYGVVTGLLIAVGLAVPSGSASGFGLAGGLQNQSVQASSLDARLRLQVSDYALTADSLLQALTRIAAEFRIPMGVVLQGSPEAGHGVKMSWHRVTVREGLDLLVKSYPGYELDTRGDVLHVYPTAIPADQHNFLTANISSLDANDDLMSDNEKLRETVSHILVPEAHAEFSKRFERGEQYRKFKAENATVRELLDRFLLATDEYKVWVVVYPTQASMTKTGFRRTLSPFDFRLPPDDEQPIWGIFLWGYDPVAHLFNFDWLNGRPAAASNGGAR